MLNMELYTVYIYVAVMVPGGCMTGPEAPPLTAGLMATLAAATEFVDTRPICPILAALTTDCIMSGITLIIYIRETTTVAFCFYHRNNERII